MQLKTNFTDKEMEAMGERIREAMIKRGLNSGQLRTRANIPSDRLMKKYERGCRVPKEEHLESMARVLGVSKEYILYGDESAVADEAAPEAVDGLVRVDREEQSGWIKDPKDTSPDMNNDAWGLEELEFSSAPADDAAAEDDSASSEDDGAANVVEQPSTMEETQVPAADSSEDEKPRPSARANKAEYLNPNGKAIRKYREKKGFSQREVAEALGVNVWTVGAWEKENRRITKTNAASLAKLYGVQVEKIVSCPKAGKNSNSRSQKKEYLSPNGAAMKEFRKKAGLTVKNVAYVLGVYHGSVDFWEAKKRRISRNNAERLAKLYGVRVEDITIQEPENGTIPNSSVTETGAAAKAENAIASPGAKPHEAPAPEGPAGPVKGIEIPEHPEERYCRNILYYIKKERIADKEFKEKTGYNADFFKETLKKHEKLPLDAILKTARFFKKSVEEILSDETADRIRKELEKYRKIVADLESISEF